MRHERNDDEAFFLFRWQAVMGHKRSHYGAPHFDVQPIDRDARATRSRPRRAISETSGLPDMSIRSWITMQLILLFSCLSRRRPPTRDCWLILPPYGFLECGTRMPHRQTIFDVFGPLPS